MRRTGVVMATRVKQGKRVAESVLFSRTEDTTVPVREYTGVGRLLYKVTQGSYYAVRLPLLRSGFKRVAKESLLQCNVIWRRPFSLGSGEKEEAGLVPVDEKQWVNHFPSSYIHLGSKDGLYLALRKMVEEFGESFYVTPKTWVLPSEHQNLLRYTKDNPDELLISKPARGSCGREIHVIKSGDEALSRLLTFATAPSPPPSILEDGKKVYKHRTWVVQKYLEDPCLINERKFDLRLYVAVTSINPLVVYVYQEGLARFASETYDEGTRLSQLTNTSLSRRRDANLRKVVVGDDGEQPTTAATSEDQVDPMTPPPKIPNPHKYQVQSRPEDPDDDDTTWPRFKWSISELKQHLVETRGEAVWESVWGEICNVVLKTMLAAERPISKHLEERDEGGVYLNQSFELYGFDVMLDSALRPWLIEVNCIPSLESSSAMDWAIKCGSMTDLLNMLMLESFERNADDMKVRCQIDAAQENLKELQKQDEPPLTTHIVDKISTLTASLTPPPPITHHWDPEDFAQRIREEHDHRGGYQRIFPTKQSIEANRKFFENSPSQKRNEEVWEKLGLA